MEKISILVISILVFTFSFQSVALAKTLPQAKGGKKTTVSKAGVGIALTPRLSKDRKALLIYFGNLQNAESVSYMLIYKTNGREEGAGGSVKPSEGNASRELLFGTCSKNVCRYHTNITNMKLEVTAKLKSGKTVLKRYRIRV